MKNTLSAILEFRFSRFAGLFLAAMLCHLLVSCGESAPPAQGPGHEQETKGEAAAPLPAADNEPATAAVAHCEAAEKARLAGDQTGWEHHVKEAFLLFDTSPLPADISRRVLDTALAYAQATPGEEGSVVAIRFALQTLDWSPEKRDAFQEYHFAEQQYREIDEVYKAADAMARSNRRLNEQLGGGTAPISVDTQLLMRHGGAFQLYLQAKERFEAFE